MPVTESPVELAVRLMNDENEKLLQQLRHRQSSLSPPSNTANHQALQDFMDAITNVNTKRVSLLAAINALFN